MPRRQAGERVNVLWLVKGLGPGGAERLLLLHARHGRAERFRYTCAYALPHKTHLVPALEEAGAEVLRLPARPLGWPAAIRRLVQDGSYDVVHTHSPLLAAAARVAVRSLPPSRRPRLVATEHNGWASFRVPTRWANAITYPLTDHGFAVSTSVLRSVWWPLRSRVELLVHGVAVDELTGRGQEAGARLRRELDLDEDQVLVLTVANLRRQKAYPDLLRAAAALAEDCPRAVFAAVGQGPLHEEVHRLRDELGLAGRFHLLGHREDVVDLLAAADVFVLASHWEGLPIAVVEALAAGVPVVSTRVGGLPEAVTDGVHGLLVPPGRPDELAAAVRRLVEDDSLRRRLADAARLRGGDFDIRVAVRRIEEVYGELTGKPGLTPSVPVTPLGRSRRRTVSQRIRASSRTDRCAT
jgi:glycosyltransferase involved in cell wall biosynthesis